jgi:hypothetical protein
MSMSGAAAAQLQADVLQLSRAVAAKNWGTARTALGELRADLSAARATGSVGAAKAAAIDAAANEVAGDIPPVVAPKPASPTPTKKPSPAPAPTQHKKHDGGGGGDGGGGDGGDGG